MVSISMDQNRDAVKEFLKKEKISCSIALDRSEVFNKYEVNGIPDTFFVDRSGRIMYRVTGFRPNIERDIKSKIEQLLKYKPPASSERSSSGKRYAIVCAGAYGDPQHYEWYWGATSGMYDILRKKYGYDRRNIIFLFGDKHGNDSRVDYVSIKRNIQNAFALLGKQMKREDSLFCYFVGHGGRSREGGSYYAAMDGPIKDVELNIFRSSIQSENQTYTFSQCNSGGFCKALGRPGTVVVTSTRVDEPNRAGFAEAIRDALGGAPKADTDKNGKVSIGEAYNYTVREIRDWYLKQGRLLEHPQIEDNGDGRSGYGEIPKSGHGDIALSRYLN